MSLILYNTFTKKEEPFTPLEHGKVKMYTCGPTVYGRPHIGNYASFLMADLLRRWLEVSGYEVTHVKNITDVGHMVADQDHGEDKIEKQAREEKVDPLAIARKYTEQYLEDEQALHMLEPAHRPRATETIPEMIAIIEELLKSGHAYETADGIYFAVETFPAYGALSGNTLDQLHAGARIAVKEEKRHPADFALWKRTVGENAHHVLKWPSPWGEGFPGWHIECSAMSRKFLGTTLDIHTGGEDNIFPHHECEIAQSESAGSHPFVRFWLHRRRIDISTSKEMKGAQKMSKSLGNVLSIPDILAAGYDPLDLRYHLLSVHYRTRLKFSWKGMDDARKARRKILEWMEHIERDASLHGTTGTNDGVVGKTWELFRDAMNADLNTPAALGEIFNLMNYYYKAQPFVREEIQQFQLFFERMQKTFGCFEPRVKEDLPPEVCALLEERARARQQKDFESADRLRGEMRKRGFDVRDTPEGQRIERLSDELV